jgi:hypothetical protein
MSKFTPSRMHVKAAMAKNIPAMARPEAFAGGGAP